jgi:hypothetical protein
VATIEAENLGRIREKLQDGIRFATRKAENIAVLYRGGRNFKPDDATAFFGSTQRAADLYERDQRLGKMQKRAEKRAERARVITEIDPYGKGSPHSWVSDVLTVSDTSGLSIASRNDPGPEERLQRSQALGERAIAKGTKYGKALIAERMETWRQKDVALNRQTVERESRSLTTGGGATASAAGGGTSAFTTPAILFDAWAEYRSPYRAFADQCNSSVALPAYGMQVYIVDVSTGTSVSAITENSSVPEADPAAGFINGAVTQQGGQIKLSQAVLDRVGPGISADIVLFQQLKSQLGAQIDVVAITAALANAQAVTNSGSTFALAGTSGVGGFLGDLRTARGKLTDAAGVRLRATHLFAYSDFTDTIQGWADANGHPVFEPAFDDNCLPIRAAGDPNGEGFTGSVVSGLAMVADDNIPASGSNAQLIVTRPNTILLLEGAPRTYIRPQFQGGSLEPTLGVYEYLTCIPRWPTGVAAISGAYYATSQFS